jgi:hypothetical protein
MSETLQAYGILDTAKYYCTLSLMEYSRPEPFDEPQFVLDKIIRLPLPAELRDDTAVAYNNIDMKLVGDVLNDDIGSGLMAQGLRSAAAVPQALGASLSEAGGTATSFGVGMLASVAGSVVSENADSFASAIQQTMGVAPNPNPAIAFQGPQLREMSLTWTLLPTNESDSRKIRSLINHLKMRALPGNQVTDSAAILNYPYLCQVNFYPWDNGGGGDFGWSENSIIRMKRAFMSSVNVNYTAGSAPAFFSGFNNEPVVVQLSINFKEIEYFLSNDFGGKNGGGSVDLWAKGTEFVGGLIENVQTGLTGGSSDSSSTDGASDT